MGAGTRWEPFLTTSAAALAALAGLIFVSISINLEQILRVRGLTWRGMEALGLLIGSLILALLALVPGVSGPVYFGVALAVALLLTAVTAYSTWFLFPVRRLYPVVFALKVVFAVACLPPFYGAAFGNLAWLTAAIVLSILSASISAWILLVEINRDRPGSGTAAGGASPPPPPAGTRSRARSQR